MELIYLSFFAVLGSALCMSHKVFVYGTLKRNEPNHHWLTDENNGDSVYISEGTTTTKYPLIVTTKYDIPFLLYVPGSGHFVKGDVFKVDDKMLSRLDLLEGHPKYYDREIDDIKVFNRSSNEEETMKCWVYFMKNFKPSLLQLPMIKSYTSYDENGKPYVEKTEKDPAEIERIFDNEIMNTSKNSIKEDSDNTIVDS